MKPEHVINKTPIITKDPDHTYSSVSSAVKAKIKAQIDAAIAAAGNKKTFQVDLRPVMSDISSLTVGQDHQQNALDILDANGGTLSHSNEGKYHDIMWACAQMLKTDYNCGTIGSTSNSWLWAQVMS